MMRAFLYFAAAPAVLLLAFQANQQLVESRPAPVDAYQQGQPRCAQLFAANTRVRFRSTATPANSLGYGAGATLAAHTGVNPPLFVRPFTAPVDEWTVSVKDAGLRRVELKSNDGRFLAVCTSTANTVEPGALSGHYAKLNGASSDKSVWEWRIVQDSPDLCRVVLQNVFTSKQLTPCAGGQCPSSTGTITDAPLVAARTDNQFTFDVDFASAPPANNNQQNNNQQQQNNNNNQQQNNQQQQQNNQQQQQQQNNNQQQQQNNNNQQQPQQQPNNNADPNAIDFGALLENIL